MSQSFPETRVGLSNFTHIRKQAGVSVSEAAELLGYTTRQVYRWESGECIPKSLVLEKLKSIKNKDNNYKKTDFTFIDLFAGIGGLRLGFEKIGGKCVFTSEWDKYSQMTYSANFPNDDHEISGDITQIKETEIPPHDVLLAGFPCQPFSIAGVSKKNALNRPHGFACDTQGTLFFDIVRILQHHKPKAFLLENVKNLLSHDKGRTFKVICRILREELGYHIDWKILDASSWLPQKRKRIFIAGFRSDNGFSFQGMYVPDPAFGPRLSSILHPEDGSEVPDEKFIEVNNGKVSNKYTLSHHLWNYLQGYAEKHKARGNGFGFGLCGPNDVARTLSARYYKDGAEILISQKNKPPRRLTPRECARLMGFDRGMQNNFIIPVSDTQAYKQFGNSVAVPVVEAVATYMQKHILKECFENSINAA